MKTLTVIGGIACVIAGVCMLIYMVKNHIPKGEDTNKHNFQGYGSGIAGIIIGIALIIEGLKS